MFKLVSLKVIGFKRLELEEPLVFPEGRVLIYGRNESGKSTIMEAVHYALYGYPLYPTKKASNEDVIRYGRGEALVELAFTVDPNKYTVRRIIKAKGSNVHELRIQRPDGGLERIIGARRVNEAIVENLHGLDSDALLNSCLVEQKELGKLESGNRNERVKAMTNLLNIEAFVDAHEEIRDAQRDLERDNSSTREHLAEAEVAKHEYEEAEAKRKAAEGRVSSIKQELGITEARLIELDKLLTSLERARNLANDIDKKQLEISGLEDSLQRIRESLDEANEASQRAEELEAQLPSANERAEQAQKKAESLDRLIRIESQLRETQQKQAGVKKLITNASKKVDESQEAKQRVVELTQRITEYEPATIANDLLPSIEALDRRIVGTREAIERAKDARKEAESRLTDLKGSEERLGDLEKKTSGLTHSRERVKQTRTISLLGMIAGFAILAASIIMPLLAVGGIPLILIGGILLVRSSTAKLDAEITSLQEEKNTLLGDKQRIGDYVDSLEKAQIEEKTGLDGLRNTSDELDERIKTLPIKPRDYASEIKNSGNFFSIRSLVTEDLQTLTRLTTEREKADEVSNELEVRQSALKALEEESRGYVEGLGSVQKKISEYHESGVDSEKEKKIRKEGDEANHNLTRITEEIRGKHEAASKIPKIRAELTQSTEDHRIVKTDLTGMEEERRQILSDSGADPKDEKRLKREDELLKARSSSLGKELELKDQQIAESTEIMEDNEVLRDEHPLLESRNASERFEIDAMTRSMKLLDLTRDGIMSGVKKSVEAHMAQFLPTLTENRYNLARIDDEEYQIEAYDREARMWRRKGVFSGGTQDQFSLALRLAFALSTIPETRGARPGFIFLDEPLSSFDSQRREGFMNLLKNELSRSFPQIIVISHIEQLQEEFPNLVQLDSGRVVSTI